MNPPAAIPGQRIVGEPRRLRHELAWSIELPDGRPAVLAQLAPELAAEPTLRRRWVVDMERIAALPAGRIAATIAIGPQPDPRAVDAEPPWRVRLDPPGQTLDAVLRRAPLPIDEVIELGARLADAVQSLHTAGVILRDFDPRSIVLGADGELWFTDVGHARLAILSSRTASSLLLESSPYIAAEALLGTVVDARADVYSLGVVLWRALTGRVPFEASLLASRTELPKLASLRPEVPVALATLVTRCLAHEPEARPPTARDVAEALRGRGTEVALVVTRTTCQACGAEMRAGLRLCLTCGKQAVRFHHTAPGDLDGVAIVLDKATDDAKFVATLTEFYETVGTSVPKLNFVVGDRRMYSKAELAQRHALPAKLVADLEPDTSVALVKRLRDGGIKVRTSTPRLERKRRRRAVSAKVVGALSAAGGIMVLATGGHAVVAGGTLLLLVGLFVVMLGAMGGRRLRMNAKRPAIGALRAAPAALPAGDVHVAAVAGVLASAKAADVRPRLEELAVLVQRLCDAKAAVAGNAASAAELEHLAAPVKPLVDLARTTVEAIDAIDHQLATLDEGAMVRALARSEARHEAAALRVDLLAGLDTLRELEDQRAVLFGRLLEITSLTRSAVELGLGHSAAIRSDDVEVAHALAGLE